MQEEFPDLLGLGVVIPLLGREDLPLYLERVYSRILNSDSDTLKRTTTHFYTCFMCCIAAYTKSIQLLEEVFQIVNTYRPNSNNFWHYAFLFFLEIELFYPDHKNLLAIMITNFVDAFGKEASFTKSLVFDAKNEQNQTICSAIVVELYKQGKITRDLLDQLFFTTRIVINTKEPSLAAMYLHDILKFVDLTSEQLGELAESFADNAFMKFYKPDPANDAFNRLLYLKTR